MVFTCFLKSLGAKTTVNTLFFTPRKPKTTVFTVFFAPGSKNHSIYSVLWPAPSRNSGIYAVFSMLQEVLFPCQKHKNTVNYSALAFETRWKTSENNQQVSKMELLFQAPQNGSAARPGSGPGLRLAFVIYRTPKDRKVTYHYFTYVKIRGFCFFSFLELFYTYAFCLGTLWLERGELRLRIGLSWGEPTATECCQKSSKQNENHELVNFETIPGFFLAEHVQIHRPCKSRIDIACEAACASPELPAVLQFLCRMAPLRIPNWASSSAAANGQSEVRWTKKAKSFGSYIPPKQCVYIQNFGLYPTNCVYLPKLCLYPKIQFIPQKLWLYRLYPKKIVLSPKFDVISQKSFCTQKNWGISQNFRLSPIQFLPRKLGISLKNGVISRNWWYTWVWTWPFQRGAWVIQSCGSWHSFKSLARNRRAAASSELLLRWKSMDWFKMV